MYTLDTRTPNSLVRVWVRSTTPGAPLTARWVNSNTLETPTTCMCDLHKKGGQPCA